MAKKPAAPAKPVTVIKPGDRPIAPDPVGGTTESQEGRPVPVDNGTPPAVA